MPTISLFPQVHELLIMLRNLSFLRVAGMNEQAVAQFEMFPLGELDEIGLALHRREAGLVAAERVGGHQAVAANMPTGRVRVLGIGEDGDADRLAVNRAGVIAPVRDAAPAVLLRNLAVGILDF